MYSSFLKCSVPLPHGLTASIKGTPMQHAVKFYKTNLSLFKKLKEASFNNTKQWVLGTFISNNIWQILTAPWSVLLFKCTRIQNDIQQLITSYTITGMTRLNTSYGCSAYKSTTPLYRILKQRGNRQSLYEVKISSYWRLMPERLVTFIDSPLTLMQ